MNRLNRWLTATKLKYWYVYGLVIFTITTTVFSLSIIIYSHYGTQAAKQRIYESSLWNALQFQLQSYRFLNYLVQIKPSDLPLNGAAYAQYDLLMSRVDLLRNGEVGYLIRGLTGGRTVRLLNIITGDLELISLNLSKIEGGNLSYLPDMVTRLKRLDNQVNEFTVLVSQGTNKYIARERRALGDNLNRVRILMVCFLVSLLALILCIFKVFSDFRKNQKNNEKLNKDILHVHEEKAKLLNLVAQETRPHIQALLSLTSETNLDPNHAKMSQSNIKQAANELSHTMNMFNDLALLDAHKLHLSPSSESLRKNVEDCVQVFAAKLHKKELKLVSYLSPDLPEMVYMDFKRFREILLELIQNAITHTSEGSISVHIRPSSMTPSLLDNAIPNFEAAMLQIAVKDTGFGLEHTLQNSLRISPFLPNHKQAEQDNDSGLGLSLCYRLVRLMEGEMHFSSEANAGTEFWVDIPYQFDPSQSKAVTAPADTIRKRALVFSQDSHLISLLRLQLAQANIDVGRFSDTLYEDYDNIDLILLLDGSQITTEAENSLQQWQKNGATVLFDEHLDIAHKAYAKSGKALPFPLTQTQLKTLIDEIFESDTSR